MRGRARAEDVKRRCARKRGSPMSARPSTVSGSGSCDRDVARHAFLQQQFGRLDRSARHESARACPVAAARWRWRSRSFPDDGPYRRGRWRPSAPSGSRARRVVERFVPAVTAARRRAPARRAKLRAAACGSIIAASAVAYGAMTVLSPRPRLKPEIGMPKLEY